jgi:hypothetical protein
MPAEDLSEETSLLEAERKAYRRRNAMKCLLGIMIAHEDEFQRAMTLDEVLRAFNYPDVDAEDLLREMLDRSLVARWIAQGAKEDCGYATVVTICDAWGTKFFGRDWFRNDDHDSNAKNVHFYFAERPI